MSKIQELIAEYCPDGVEWIKLEEIFEISRGRVISKDDLAKNAGIYPVYSSQTVKNGVIGKINTFDYSGEYLTWTTDGANAGTIFYRNEDFSITNVCGLLKVKNTNILSAKYSFFFLSVKMKDYVNYGMGNPKLMSNVVQKISIPIPPLAVQQEIVNILDKFNQLEAELEAELEARTRQYDFYRNQLLAFEGVDMEWKSLGNVGEFVRGNGLQKKDFTDNGVGCIHYGQIYTYYGTSATKTKSFVSETLAKKLKKASKNDLVIAGVSENVEDVCKAVVWLGDEDICVSGDAFIYKHKQNPKFIGYLFQTKSFLEYKKRNAQGAKVTRLKSGSLPKFLIPVPTLKEQQRIVQILDQFDALVNDIKVGLPAEINARRQQYEYYRNKLLTFKKAN